jgi:hypothetical protein
MLTELSPVDENKEREHTPISRKHLQKSASTTALTLLINPNGMIVDNTVIFLSKFLVFLI